MKMRVRNMPFMLLYISTQGIPKVDVNTPSGDNEIMADENI